MAIIAVTLLGCADSNASSDDEIRVAQSKAILGPTKAWPTVKGFSPQAVQEMRDRAYRFCMMKRPGDKQCLADQDASIFAVVGALRLLPILKAEKDSTFPYARAYQANPNAFAQVWEFCWRTYSDNGRNDARMLGPCVMSGVGGDFHGIVPVN